MNELTKRLVEQTARKHKTAARKNDAYFHFLVTSNYWDYLLGYYGGPLKARAERLFISISPSYADEAGYLADEWYMSEIDERLSDIVVRLIERMVAADPGMQLDDWGDYPVRLAEPQLSLFQMEQP